MPPTRKSGSAHSSKARSARQEEEQAGSSSSGPKAELGAARESNGGEEGMQSSVDEVHDLLEQFETQPQPLRAHVSDGKLKSLRSDWASMEGNFEIAYQLITQVAERLAEARSMEGIIDEDENLQELDVGMRGMIDLQENVKHRRRALEELRARVGSGEAVLDAAEAYRSRTAQLQDEHQGKTLRQRYGHSKVYNDYKVAVWGALRDDDMPPLLDLLPPDANDAEDDDDDDDVVAYGGDRQKFKCPLSLHVMTDPLKSTICQHAFERQSILAYLGNATKQCPTGCPAKLNANLLASDPVFTRACQKYARREASRRERERTQAQATMLD